METNLVVDFMASAFSRKLDEIMRKKDTCQFEDTVYQVFENRYGVKKKVKQKCEEFLLGLRDLSKTDERADDFKKFMGFDDPKKYAKEVLNLYLQHLHKTEESFYTLYGDECAKLDKELLEGIKLC